MLAVVEAVDIFTVKTQDQEAAEAEEMAAQFKVEREAQDLTAKAAEAEALELTEVTVALEVQEESY